MKKAIGMFAALMVALAMSGVAYACWTETLYIEGSVETGDLCAEIIAGESFDSEPDEKNVSEISCYVDGSTLVVTVYNAYPSICYHQFFSIHNCGTIPLDIDSITPVGDIPDEIDVVVSMADAPHGEQYLTLPIQLEPCEYAYFVIVVHVAQTAEETATYTFAFEIDITNWNCDG